MSSGISYRPALMTSPEKYALKNSAISLAENRLTILYSRNSLDHF
jgi:hypothetical protein